MIKKIFRLIGCWRLGRHILVFSPRAVGVHARLNPSYLNLNPPHPPNPQHLNFKILKEGKKKTYVKESFPPRARILQYSSRHYCLCEVKTNAICPDNTALLAYAESNANTRARVHTHTQTLTQANNPCNKYIRNNV